MIETKQSIPTWILIVSGLFALIEIMVSVSLIISPESVLETVDVNAKGVHYLVYMWASRQFAVGFILGYATLKKSIPMLTLAYIFLLVMFLCDVFIGISQKDNSLVIAALVMCLVSSLMLYVINRRNKISV